MEQFPELVVKVKSGPALVRAHNVPKLHFWVCFLRLQNAVSGSKVVDNLHGPPDHLDRVIPWGINFSDFWSRIHNYVQNYVVLRKTHRLAPQHWGWHINVPDGTPTEPKTVPCAMGAENSWVRNRSFQDLKKILSLKVVIERDKSAIENIRDADVELGFAILFILWIQCFISEFLLDELHQRLSFVETILNHHSFNRSQIIIFINLIAGNIIPKLV